MAIWTGTWAAVLDMPQAVSVVVVAELPGEGRLVGCGVRPHPDASPPARVTASTSAVAEPYRQVCIPPPSRAGNIMPSCGDNSEAEPQVYLVGRDRRRRGASADRAAICIENRSYA